jgi:hypothetical protein
MMPRLPSRSELELAGLVALAFFIAAYKAERDKRVARDTIIAMKPRVEYRDRVVEKRVVVRGPTRIVKVEAPDGTKTTTIDKGAETATTDKDRDLARSETPVCPPPDRVKTIALGGSLNLKHRDRGAASISKSFGDLSLSLGHDVGGPAKLGDASAGMSIKLF